MRTLASLPAEPKVVLANETGQLHLRYRISGRMVDDARCRIVNWTVLEPDLLVGYDVESYCEYCFPANPRIH